MTNRETEPHGVLVVDKAAGFTSHDVVAIARRALGTRAIGHTGTLDPMATGVLVLAVGEATKLVNHLAALSKRYASMAHRRALSVEPFAMPCSALPWLISTSPRRFFPVK